MRELLRTNDPVLISALLASLEAEGIAAFVFDAHTSILEGSVSAIPRRIMVEDERHDDAQAILEAIESAAS